MHKFENETYFSIMYSFIISKLKLFFILNDLEFSIL